MVNQAVGTRPSADRNEVKQIVDDMMVQVGHVGIQQEGCKTIIELAKASHSLIDRIEGLIAVGAHFAIMNAMLAHSKDVKMQRLGCQAVGASAAGQSDQRLCGELLLVGAHLSVMAAMSTHPDDVEIHYNGCRALKWFTQRGSSEQCRLLLSAGVLMQMLQALQRHGSHPGASEEALTAMVRMLQMSLDDGQVPVHERILIFENRKWLLQLGASHAAQFAFIAIMRAFSPSPLPVDPMITGENGAGIEHVRAASATMQARSIKTWSGVVMFLKDLGLPVLDVFFDIVSMVQFCQRRQFIWLSCIVSALAFHSLGAAALALAERNHVFHSLMWSHLEQQATCGMCWKASAVE